MVRVDVAAAVRSGTILVCWLHIVSKLMGLRFTGKTCGSGWLSLLSITIIGWMGPRPLIENGIQMNRM